MRFLFLIPCYANYLQEFQDKSLSNWMFSILFQPAHFLHNIYIPLSPS